MQSGIEPLGQADPGLQDAGRAFFHGVRIAITSGNEAPTNVQLPVRMDKAAFLDWVRAARNVMSSIGKRHHDDWRLAGALADYGKSVQGSRRPHRP